MDVLAHKSMFRQWTFRDDNRRRVQSKDTKLTRTFNGEFGFNDPWKSTHLEMLR